MATRAGGIVKTPEKLYKIKSKIGSAEDIALLQKDQVVVADRTAGAIKVFDSDGHYEKTFCSKVRPYGITCSRSGLIAFSNVSGKKTHNIQIYTQDGQHYGTWGDDMHWKPYAVATTSRGQLVISDVHEFKHTVGIYTYDGRCITKFGDKGKGKNEFMQPWYLAVDGKDRILVSDRGNHCVKVFDSNGKHLIDIGAHGSGSGPGMLRSPRGLATDAECNIMVSDTGNRRISVFSPSGKFIQHLMTRDDGLAYPFGLEYNREGTLIVSNHGSSGGSSFKKIRAYKVA